MGLTREVSEFIAELRWADIPSDEDIYLTGAVLAESFDIYRTQCAAADADLQCAKREHVRRCLIQV